MQVYRLFDSILLNYGYTLKIGENCKNAGIALNCLVTAMSKSAILGCTAEYHYF